VLSLDRQGVLDPQAPAEAVPLGARKPRIGQATPFAARSARSAAVVDVAGAVPAASRKQGETATRDPVLRFAKAAPMCATPGAITDQDVDEFTRTFARPDGFAGASGLYRSMLNEGEEIQGLAAQSKLQMPVLAVGAGSGNFPHHTMTQVAKHVSAATLDGVGHYAAMEAPEALAQALLDFYRSIDA
jgi:pimeloyl-ACP methyl ester carboxylesterase